jgi:prephenate dehydrogenase
VVGTGLIGTSIALALTEHGVRVHLRDIRPERVATAVALSAGVAEPPEEPCDMAVLAVSPTSIATTLRLCQEEQIARSYMDVGSVKALPLLGALELDCDLTSYIGGHPMAGRERSGPLAAQSHLFEGRPWVLTPSQQTGNTTLNAALEVISICRGVPVVMEAMEHDRAVALVSHAPQVVASVMAGQLEHAPTGAMRLAGQGLRDVSRMAAGDPALWSEILAANADSVADVLEGVTESLAATVDALRAMTSSDEMKVQRGHRKVRDVLVHGCAGHARIPVKPGSLPLKYSSLSVQIADRPGELARLLSDVGSSEVNLEDLSIEHSPGMNIGTVELMVDEAEVRRLAEILSSRDWSVHE